MVRGSPLQAALLACCFAGAAAVGSSEIVVGDVRVQALSATLLRVEPKGPMGFENRTTFMVTSRNFTGIPIALIDTTPAGTLLSTTSYDVLLRNTSGTCPAPKTNTDANNAQRSKKFPKGAHASSSQQCCDLCTSDPSCITYVFQPSTGNCWPLSSSSTTHTASDRSTGVATQGPSFKVTSPSGQVLYDTNAQSTQTNLLHWPAPLAKPSYALTDRPRFFTPEWGTAPIPDGAKVDPALKQTNGYDFRNNVVGDTYVFLLGSDLRSWGSSRAEFLQLAGSCPLLPDFAYGTWFTWWHSYKEAEAKNDIERWENLSLPIDVWALDMNWRNTSNHQDRYYNHSNTNLFPNFTEWFKYLEEHKLRTYFNDHPFPVQDRGAGGGQTSPEEVAFRWNGLSEWMAKGLTYWWFDHNWGFSIPPPFVDTFHTSGDWEGLDNAAWGSHVYYNAVAYFDKTVRDKAGDKAYGGRPMTLTKFGLPDWRPGMDPVGHAESPAQHRFPVWWTGDGVNLQASVESMVHSGVHDFKPFVHSDCGGDYRGSAGDLLRWTAHCAYGSILRFHGNDHRSWTYDTNTVNTVRSYLNARYKLIPSLIAAGQRSTKTGFPLVARGDFYWPEHKESASDEQYIFLDDILVAPIFDSKQNVTSRSVWVPPGEWQDVWDGSIVTGPKTITTTQPFERQPMWHRQNGGLLVTTDKPGTRVDDQDWSLLTLEAYPSSNAQRSTRTLFERESEARTDIVFTTDGQGNAQLEISNAEDGTAREWTVRMHLRKGERATSASVDGKALSVHELHLQPHRGTDFFPLGGMGTAPASNAGPIVELQVPRGAHARVINVAIEAESMVDIVL